MSLHQILHRPRMHEPVSCLDRAGRPSATSRAGAVRANQAGRGGSRFAGHSEPDQTVIECRPARFLSDIALLIMPDIFFIEPTRPNTENASLEVSNMRPRRNGLREATYVRPQDEQINQEYDKYHRQPGN